MRGRRTTLVRVLVAVPIIGLAATITSACDFGPSADVEPSPGPTLVAVEPAGGELPELTETLDVELGTAVAVFGLGCRPRSTVQRCSQDGSQTYTLASRRHDATVTAAWMQLDAGRGQWAVHVRLRTSDARAIAAIRDQTRRVGGLAVVLDAHTGDVLVAIPSPDFQGVTITGHDLQQPAAALVVRSFVEAAEAS